MKAVSFALVATVPAVLAQCPHDGCREAVNALLFGGEALADYASDLCSSAIATTTTVAAGQSTLSPSDGYGQKLDSLVRRDKRSLIEDTVPGWASNCKNKAEFASACQCASVVPGTTTVTVSPTTVAISTTSSTTESSIPAVETSSSGIYPQSNTSTYPAGFSTGVPLSAFSGSALPATIQFMAPSSIEAGPTGPTTLQGPISSSTSSPTSSTSSNFTVPSGFSTGVPLSSLPAPIQFQPAANITASPTGPTTLSPVYTPSSTGDAVLPGSSSKVKREDDPKWHGMTPPHTPCQPKMVGIFFHFLTGVTNPCE